MIECRQTFEKLFDYIDKELDAKETIELEKHLDICRSCCDVKEFEVLLREKMKTKTNHCCPDLLKKRIKDLIDQF